MTDMKQGDVAELLPLSFEILKLSTNEGEKL